MTSHQIKSETVLLLVSRFVSVSRTSGVPGYPGRLCVIIHSLMSFNEDFTLEIGLPGSHCCVLLSGTTERRFRLHVEVQHSNLLGISVIQFI